MSTEDPRWEELAEPRHLADRVIEAVRRRRTAVVIAVATLALPVVLGLALVTASDGRGPAPVAQGDGRTPAVADCVAIYLAAIDDAGAAAAVYVEDPGLSRADRQGLRRVLGARVHVTAHPAGERGSSAHRVLVLGELRVVGDRATVPRTVFCGPMCAEGRTLVLVRQGRTWQVTGSRGPEWLS